MVQLSGKLFHHHRIWELSCNLGINSSNILEYCEYKRIGINTCEKLLIYRKKWFLFHGVMKSPTPRRKDMSSHHLYWVKKTKSCIYFSRTVHQHLQQIEWGHCRLYYGEWIISRRLWSYGDFYVWRNLKQKVFRSNLHVLVVYGPKFKMF